jgi:hypothetical protein
VQKDEERRRVTTYWNHRVVFISDDSHWIIAEVQYDDLDRPVSFAADGAVVLVQRTDVKVDDEAQVAIHLRKQLEWMSSALQEPWLRSPEDFMHLPSDSV